MHVEVAWCYHSPCESSFMLISVICLTEHIIVSYVYQTDIGTDIPSLVDYKYGVETLFISLLAKSKFRTMVSEE